MEINGAEIQRITGEGFMLKDNIMPPKSNMNKSAVDKNYAEILDTLENYCKYLYEEEKQRTERLEKKVNVFTAALGGSFIAVLLKIPVGKNPSAISINTIQGSSISLLIALSLLLFIISSYFTYQLYKVRNFDRLNDPKKTADKAQTMNHYTELQLTIIADYTVASNRNNQLNDIKATNLSRALFSLVLALISIVAAFFIFKLFN